MAELTRARGLFSWFEIFFETDLCFTCTDISIASKEEPSDKLDMLLNPEKAKQRDQHKRMAMDDLRDGRHSTVT